MISSLTTWMRYQRGRLWVLQAVAVSLLSLAGRASQAQVAGVSIDAEGVLRAEYSRQEAESLAARRREAFASAQLPTDLVTFTPMRRVSLRGIEQALAEQAAKSIPMDLRYLYGLQRIEYIFIDPERSDVILAGPAEGYAPDPSGRMVGLTTGRPPLQLDDLLTALRWGAAGGGRGQVGCSIDPEPQRLANLQSWLAQNSTPAPRNVAQARYDRMAEILGYQNVSVLGVPDNSHLAQVLVEADFRMKLIALGKENPGVRGVRSSLSLLTPQGNSMQRWWFTPLYEPIEVDDAGLAFHLQGQRCQLLAQDEWSDRGRRTDATTTRASTEKFAALFTEHFEELAAESPVFAELQNVFDLTVLAALLEQEDIRRRIRWPMDLMLDAQRLPVRAHLTPKYVESRATSVFRSRVLLGLVGGVAVVPSNVVAQPLNRGRSREVAAVRQAALSRPTEGVWWDQ